ncbi:MAG: hypothetical protein LC713_07990, partial [Actinobacteria bacterium]|nr:hypothetical protein [Actinomycetota bacterium]
MVKRAADGAQAVRIAAEAEVLGAIQIPGVVELVAVAGDAGRPCLVTARVAGPDLGRAPDLTVDEVAGVIAAVATVLADLHDLGMVHGAVMASHVLLGDEGRPVLCGFGYGGRAGDPPVAEPPLPEGHRDPARRPGEPLTPSGDVHALGALLRHLVTKAPATAPGSRHQATRWMAAIRRRAPRAPFRPTRPGRPTDRSVRAALLAAADRATSPDPELRPGARSLAAAVGVAVPGARLPRHA